MSASFPAQKLTRIQYDLLRLAYSSHSLHNTPLRLLLHTHARLLHPLLLLCRRLHALERLIIPSAHHPTAAASLHLTKTRSTLAVIFAAALVGHQVAEESRVGGLHEALSALAGQWREVIDAYTATLVRRVAASARCAGRLLEERAFVAADGGSTEWVAEAVGELSAGFVDLLAGLEHSAAVLPVVC